MEKNVGSKKKKQFTHKNSFSQDVLLARTNTYDGRFLACGLLNNKIKKYSINHLIYFCILLPNRYVCSVLSAIKNIFKCTSIC